MKTKTWDGTQKRKGGAIALLCLAVSIAASCSTARIPDSPTKKLTRQSTEEPIQTRNPRFLRVLFAGDTHFAWRIARLQRRHGIASPVQSLSRLFLRSDYRILNLETSIANGGTPFSRKAYIFSASPKNLRLLKSLSIDSVVLGNNHSMDLGKEGLIETLDHLRDHGISAVGAGLNQQEARSPLLVSKDGIRISVFSYSLIGDPLTFSGRKSPGVSRVTARSFRKQIQELGRDAGFVIVSLHWGTEYHTRPSAAQIALAHKLIEAGAHAVIGHHPHVPFGVEIYKKGFIAYSLGNFLFGSVNERQDHNFIVRLDIERKSRRLHSVRIFPIFGKYREDTSESIRPLSPTESRVFWRQMIVQTRMLSPATAQRIEVNQTGEGRILIQNSP